MVGPSPLLSRRDMLGDSMTGLAGIALAYLLGNEAHADDKPALSAPHFPPKAKRVIQIFAAGGVSQVDTFTWNNPLERSTIYHQSFLPHGYALMVMFDAVGTVVDSTLLEYQLTTESRAGVPGLWTILIIYSGAWGRAQFSLVPLTGDPLAAETRASPGPGVEAVLDNRAPASGRAALQRWAKEADDERRRR